MWAFLSCRGRGEDGWDLVDVDVQMTIQGTSACMGSWMSLETCSTPVGLFTRIPLVRVAHAADSIGRIYSTDETNPGQIVSRLNSDRMPLN